MVTLMIDLLLIYPYFNDNNSIFKFPPLGLGYIASYAMHHGYKVEIIDCTFLKEEESVTRAKKLKPKVIGIYSMLSMKESSLRMARQLKNSCDLIIAGGPLPTTYPEQFLTDFDLVVIGEGEETVLEILNSLGRKSLSSIRGIAYKEGEKSFCQKIVVTPSRGFVKNLDSLPFPARELYHHEAYKKYFLKHHGYTITPMITSRGCPFDCEFCSKPVFGNSYRGRSPKNIVDEMEAITPYYYDRIWLADDIFPISRKVAFGVCDEIIKRGLNLEWECLCRADLVDKEMALKMKQAGCYRVFFGLESGNNELLKIMNKSITVDQARRATEIVKSVGIKAGAFFIIGYPGEDNNTMLDTIRFASSLPLDYLSFTVPYPIPGTKLYEKLKERILVDDWKKPKRSLIEHVLLYKSEFSMAKLKFGIVKAMIQHYSRRHFGPFYPVTKPFETLTDYFFKVMK